MVQEKEYQEAIEWIFIQTPNYQKQGKGAYKPGLGNITRLCDFFGNPHKKLKCIHIGGTNGKGSTSNMLASILQEQGYKVGLYTSPHLIDFTERIKVNGQNADKDFIYHFIQKLKNLPKDILPSFFEFTTIMAFEYFHQQEVDFAIIEVGLGGRLDCTNIINPLLSIITNISLDHTQFLGDTLPKIAYEKAGIIKQGTPVVVGEALPETRIVFEAKAQEMDAMIVFAEDIPMVQSASANPKGGRIYQTRLFGTIEGELGGIYQDKNTNTLLTAVMQLYNKQIIRNIDSVAKGFSNVCEATGLMGRWQQIQQNPTVVCDTGHNEAGWKDLSLQIKSQKYRTLRIVFGMVDDKDIEAVMALLPDNAIYYWTQPSTKRAFSADKVARIGKQYNLEGRTFADVAEAYEQALSEAESDDFIFVGGSSYIVADFLSQF